MNIKHWSSIYLFIFLHVCVFFLASTPAVFAISATSSTEVTIKKAQAGSKEAQFQLGYRYEKGKQVKRNLSKAIKWYRKAANKGHIKAQDRLANLYYRQKKYDKARFWLKKRAISGNSEAQFLLGNTYRYGYGAKTSAKKAHNWYKKAAKKGHKQAQYELARMYRNGIGAKKDHDKALKWFKQAAKKGHREAKKVVGEYEKKLAKNNPLQQTTKRAENNDANAQYDLGVSYWNGKSAKKNDKKAYYWTKKAAENNHVKAQFNLAMMYLQGTTHITKDLEQARLWLIKASENEHNDAEKQLNELARLNLEQSQIDAFSRMVGKALLGDTEEQYELGMRYLLGYKISKDYQQAYYWLNQAAESQHPLAMYQLGNRYLSGKDVEQNMEKAIEYFASASKKDIVPAKTALHHLAENGFKQLIDAIKGDEIAQYEIAQSYLQNEINLSNKTKALTWLKKSSAKNHIPALLDLGKIYQEGKLVPKNLEQAQEYYLTAAELNDPEAQFRLSVVSAQLEEPANQAISSSESAQKPTLATSPEDENSVKFTGIQ